MEGRRGLVLGGAQQPSSPPARTEHHPLVYLYRLSRTAGSKQAKLCLYCIIDIVYLARQEHRTGMNLFRLLYLELAELILSSDIFLWLALPLTGPSKVALKVPGSAEDLLKVVLQPWLDGVPFLVKVEFRASLLGDMFLS